MCKECSIIDDESHRINHCKKFSQRNYCNNPLKLNYDDIYSGDVDKCYNVVKVVVSMWDLENGKNEMRPD